MTWAVGPAGAPPGVDPALVDAALRRAFAAWADASPRAPRFEELPTGRDDPHLRVSFETAAHGACRPFGIDTALAHTGPVGPGTFVHFDAQREWDAASLELAALHEIGHVLGLDHVEAEGSLMFPDPAARGPGGSTTIGEAERAGLATLYGGELVPDASDLWLRTDSGAESVLLWRAAPPNTDFAAFDADGDGRDEVLVWRTDPAGQGALTLYFFDRRRRPVRTLGPLWGAVVPGTPTSFERLPSGERVLRCALEDGASLVRAFDDTGRPVADPPDGTDHGETGPDDASEDGTRGDLDGDGRQEVLFRQ